MNDGESKAPRARRARLTLAVIGAASVAAIATFVAYCTGGTGALPKAAASTALDPVAENRSCEGCHTDIAAEWRGSQHRSAFTDAAFQSALAIEPKAFCTSCHAPEDPDGQRGAAAQALGVGCVTCHLAGDTVLAAPKPFGVPPPHRIARSAEFASAGACAGCHAFSFGDDDRRFEPLAMQNTIEEHRASRHAERSCADCHMPRNHAGRRSHSFASTRDEESHRRALAVSVTRSKTTLNVHLVNHSGHAYPTGDLFRRLTIHAEAIDEDFQVRAAADRFLARHFDVGLDVHGRPIRNEVKDDRVVDESSIALELGPDAAALPITWSVSLDRVLHVANHEQSEAVVESRVLLSSGVAPP